MQDVRYKFKKFGPGTDKMDLPFTDILPLPESLDKNGMVTRTRILGYMQYWGFFTVREFLKAQKEVFCEPEWKCLSLYPGMRSKISVCREMLRTSLNHHQIRWADSQKSEKANK